MRDIEKIYLDFMNNDSESASATVQDNYMLMHDVFDEYIGAVQEDLFYKAYKYGFAQGLKAADRAEAKGECVK